MPACRCLSNSITRNATVLMSRLTLLARMKDLLELDKAVSLAIGIRLWQFLAGPVTLWLIGSRFSESEQGYFYTFSSILATQTFFELGLQGVLVNLTSHEWARVKQPFGFRDAELAQLQETRLASLVRLTTRWYTVCAVAFVAVIGPTGFAALRTHGNVELWGLPWCVLILLTAIALWLAPLTAFLMGCNQVATVNSFRLAQAILGNLAVWGAIVGGAGLWTPVVAVIVQITVELCLVAVRYRRLFLSLFFAPVRRRMDWKSEVWPLQWRIGIQSVAYWFGFQAFTLVMFHHAGERAAGRMGMTWTILLAIQGISMAWLQTRVPRFGQLIARREYGDLDRQFFRVVLISTAVISAITLAFGATVTLLERYEWFLAGRMLKPLPTFLFGAGVVLNHLAMCAGTYVRAHNRDPFLFAATSSSLLMAGSVWVLGGMYGATGVSAAYLGVVAFYLLPFHGIIWKNARKRWH